MCCGLLAGCWKDSGIMAGWVELGVHSEAWWAGVLGIGIFWSWRRMTYTMRGCGATKDEFMTFQFADVSQTEEKYLLCRIFKPSTGCAGLDKF